MDQFKTTRLGQTGLKVGRLGVSSSFSAPAEAFEEAFEKGCNYFYSPSPESPTACRGEASLGLQA